MKHASYKLAAVLPVLMTSIQLEKEKRVTRQLRGPAHPETAGTSPGPALRPWLPPQPGSLGLSLQLGVGGSVSKKESGPRGCWLNRWHWLLPT